MEWLEVGTFTLTNDWQYSEPVTGRDFKVIYLSSPLSGRNSTGTIALANATQDRLENSTEFFRPQKINSYLPSEIVRFPDPPKQWDYRLAIRKLILPNQFIPDYDIKIYMPAYTIAPVFNGSTNIVTPNIVAVDNTKSVTLSASNSSKIGTLVVNNSKTSRLFVSLGSPASLTNYDKALNNQEAFETPFNFNGDVYGIWDKADATGNARVKDFS